MKNKYLYIWMFIIIFVFIFYFGNSKEKNTEIVLNNSGSGFINIIDETVGKFFKAQDFDIHSISGANVGTESDLLIDKNNINDVIKNKSRAEVLVRSVCLNFDNVEELVSSKYFIKIKNKLKDYKESTINSDVFNFYELPDLINSTCHNRSTNYIDRLITYLQSDFNNFKNINIELTKNDLDKFIGKLKLSDENIDLDKLLEDKIYFNKVFFSDNLLNILSVYYPYYVMNRSVVKTFLNNPIIADFENVQMKKALFSFNNDLKDLRIDGIDGFRKNILLNNGIEKKEDLISILETDFNLLLNNNKDLDLLNNLIDNKKFKFFIMSNKYKSLITSQESMQLIESIVVNLMKFIILSNDYQDSIRESWSGREFFENPQLGEGLFRLIFVYILTKG